MSVDGTPSNFQLHPLASYDYYNQAHIHKHPPTCGKHPSCAADKEQRIYMDFGFLRASQADYSRTDKSKERVVTSFDRYSSYLLIVHEYTKYTWLYLCGSKEPTSPSTFTAAAAKTSLDDYILSSNDLPVRRLEHEMIMTHDISGKDMELVYLSPSSFNDSFEEMLDLRCFDPAKSTTAGLLCEVTNSRVQLRGMIPSTPAAKIRAWCTRLHGAWIIQINDVPINSVSDIESTLVKLKSMGVMKCTILMAHNALRDGLVETGIPQVNVDQLNDRYSLDSCDVMTQEEFDRWYSSLPEMGGP
jgi:hypothetical protein